MIRTINSIFLLLLLSVCHLKIQAQDEERTFRVGFKINPAFNWVKAGTSNILSNGSAVGFSFGFMSDIHIDHNYYYTQEINVTSFVCNVKRKDAEILTITSNGKKDSFTNVSYKYNLKYIELPVCFKFKTLDKGGLRFWGQVGIVPGFLIGNKATISTKPIGKAVFPTTDQYIPNRKENDGYDFDEYEDNVNKFRTGMIWGFGVEYKLGGSTIFYTGLRYNNGFTDFLNDKKTDMNNNSLGLELGFFF